MVQLFDAPTLPPRVYTGNSEPKSLRIALVIKKRIVSIEPQAMYEGNRQVGRIAHLLKLSASP